MNTPSSPLNRREFIRYTAQSAGTALLVLNTVNTACASSEKTFTVQDVISLILKEGGLSPLTNTVDTIKAGKPDLRVTGIVTTMFPTLAVIEETKKRGANFIIAHEPSFYNHTDAADWMADNSVQKKKLELLNTYGIAIWRFHDYCHALQPDAIIYGVAKKANWLPYFQSGKTLLTIPETSLKALAQHLKASLGITTVKVIGNLEQSCKRISLLPGAFGGRMQITTVESDQPDVLIVGEVSEWETAEYIRDKQALGSKISLIILGHSVSEEPGMEYFADWLKPKLDGITVSHIASGDPFTWI